MCHNKNSIIFIDPRPYTYVHVKEIIKSYIPEYSVINQILAGLLAGWLAACRYEKAIDSPIRYEKEEERSATASLARNK